MSTQPVKETVKRCSMPCPELELGKTSDTNTMPRMTDHFVLAVTLACYKDTAFLGKAVNLLEEVTPSLQSSFAIVIAEDVSDSSAVVEKLASRYQNILYFHNPERLGRGRALREAWRRVNADVYVFMDVDMSTDLRKMNAFSELIKKVQEDGFELVTGSRYHPDSMVYRPIMRRYASVAYNKIVRIVFGSKITDHQCGFKAFSANLVRRLADVVKTDSWFWDTEIIVAAQKKGFKVTEIPVLWVEMKGPRTPARRLLKDVWLHGSGILRLAWRVYFSGL